MITGQSMQANSPDATTPLLLDTNILIYHLQGTLPNDIKLKLVEAI